MPRAHSWLVVAAAVLLLGGCTGGDPPEEATSASASSPPVATADLTAGLAAAYADDSTRPEDLAEARCFAEALRERLDEDALAAAGIVGADGAVVDALPVFDEVTAGAWVDAQLSCVDYVEASTRALLAQSRGALDVDAYATCLRTALSDEEVRAALVQTLSGGFASPEVAALTAAQAGCADSA